MLSKEQQDIIENSLWVVNSALKKQGLQSDEDLRQSAILYMCKCIERFDPSKNIRWTTFAYKNVYLFIKRVHQKEKENNSSLLPDTMFYLADNDDNIEVYEFDTARDIIEAIKMFCTPDEKRCIELKIAGYKGAEISRMMKCSTSKVMCCMQSIKAKAKEIYEELNGDNIEKGASF